MIRRVSGIGARADAAVDDMGDIGDRLSWRRAPV